MKNNELFDYFISVQKPMEHKLAIACWGEKSCDFVSENLRNKQYSVLNIDSNFDFEFSEKNVLLEKINDLRKINNNIAFVFLDVESYSPIAIHEFAHAVVGRNFNNIKIQENDVIFYAGKNINGTNIPIPIINKSIHINLTKD